jgi:hypothetical protein
VCVWKSVDIMWSGGCGLRPMTNLAVYTVSQKAGPGGEILT